MASQKRSQTEVAGGLEVPPSLHFAFEIEVPVDFVWEITVRSFGFFLVPPNFFDRQHRTFSRPLRVTNVLRRRAKETSKTTQEKNKKNTSINKEENFAVFDTLIEHQPSNKLRVSTYLLGGSKGDFRHYSNNLDDFDRQEVERQLKQQITRMFRLDGDIKPFHSLFSDASEIGFGRLFRSPTLFEDIVKVITNCNTSFSNCQMMNRLLCLEVGSFGAFPTPQELSKWTPAQLRARCKVGYRDERIWQFSQDVVKGRFDLDWFEANLLSERLGFYSSELIDEARKRLEQIKGFGKFSVNNTLQLAGVFSIIPVDTETKKLIPYLRGDAKKKEKEEEEEEEEQEVDDGDGDDDSEKDESRKNKRQKSDVPRKSKKDSKSKKKQKASAVDMKRLEEEVYEAFSKFAPFQFLVYWFELYDYRTRFAPTNNHNSNTTPTPTPNEAVINQDDDYLRRFATFRTTTMTTTMTSSTHNTAVSIESETTSTTVSRRRTASNRTMTMTTTATTKVVSTTQDESTKKRRRRSEYEMLLL